MNFYQLTKKKIKKGNDKKRKRTVEILYEFADRINDLSDIEKQVLFSMLSTLFDAYFGRRTITMTHEEYNYFFQGGRPPL